MSKTRQFIAVFAAEDHRQVLKRLDMTLHHVRWLPSPHSLLRNRQRNEAVFVTLGVVPKAGEFAEVIDSPRNR